MRNIPGCEIPSIRRKAIERLALNIKDQSQELQLLKDIVSSKEAELDLARVTLYILENTDK